MPWHIAANALGIVLAAGYAGYVIGAERIPWGGLAAAVLYMVGAAVPFLYAYRSIDSGFQKIEQNYIASRRRQHFPPEQEPVMRRRRKPLRSIVALLILATGLLVADATDWIINPPDAQAGSETISNF